jgi:hypothetical protein
LLGLAALESGREFLAASSVSSLAVEDLFTWMSRTFQPCCMIAVPLEWKRSSASGTDYERDDRRNDQT